MRNENDISSISNRIKEMDNPITANYIKSKKISIK